VRRAPVATYRIQLHHAFTFRDLAALTPYLDHLGVSDAYCSPILTARRGSTHGYDICDHREINPELGTRAELEAVAAALHARAMGLIVDFVPNHMGIDAATNAWWRDVLENGPSSPYARYFDIDWLPVKAELRDKVLLPILGDQYGRVLERGELRLAYADGTLVLHYFDRSLPIGPRHAPLVFGHRLDRLIATHGEEADDIRELRDVLTMLTDIPPTNDTSESAAATRQRLRDDARRRLAALTERSTAIQTHVEDAVRAFNGEPGIAASFDQLHTLLEMQVYRLAYWRTAFDEINYRRFFDINELAGLRMEDPSVFADTHALILDLIAEGVIGGLRLDHPDGLFDPTAYFEDLVRAIADRSGLDASLGESIAPPVYLVVEKILGRGERLRDSWRVHGTTGYNFLNTVNGLFVHDDGLAELRRCYRRFTGWRSAPEDTAYHSKRLMMRSAMASELNVLARALNRRSEGDRVSRDFTLNGLRRALVEVIACFPVYRTYVGEHGASAEDASIVDHAIAEARRRNPIQEPSIFEFIRAALLPGPTEPEEEWHGRVRRAALAQKFQQYTAPVVAKGLEDTAFYNDVLLLSANEVGGDLAHRSRSIAELHRSNTHRLTRWPLEMTASSTHDTKRGEDARARINVLSEVPDEWRRYVRLWSRINEAAHGRAGQLTAPDRNDEWLFYQALVGAWPAERLDAPVPARVSATLVERMQRFMRKALKEAKRHTGWLHENIAYEQGVEDFVGTVLAGDGAAPFLASFVPFERRIAHFGMVGSLAQLVVRLGSPGVPDIYQGSELWDFSMVDPDNRQAVDFAHRRALLEGLTPLLAAPSPLGLRALLDDWTDGRAKLYTLTQALRLRRKLPALFLEGDYEGVGSDGDDPHLIAFIRRHGHDELVVLAPRFVSTLLRGSTVWPLGMERWRTASVRLPRRLVRARFVNIFTQEIVEPVVYRDVPWLLAGSAFQSWPVAMLRVL
jgi:(1->4)-alpha-D-glucan 1-alpha-D-glucosylmutase